MAGPALKHPVTTGQASFTFRTVASLLLFVHLFCVTIGVWSNLAPSPLQMALLGRLAPYTTFLNFDLNFTPYHLTHGTRQDVDDRLEVLPSGADAEDPAAWIVLPDAGWRGGDRYKRYQRLAETISFFADQQAQAGLLAKGVAEHYLHAQGITPAQIRTRKHLLLPRLALQASRPPDPNAPEMFVVPYAANVVISDGSVEVIHISEQSEVALPDANTQ